MRLASLAAAALLAGCSSTGQGVGAGGGSDASGSSSGGSSSGGGPEDSGSPVTPDDATVPSYDAAGAYLGEAGNDSGIDCVVGNVGGQCGLTSDCLADAGYTATPGYCPGPADIQCCTLTPNVAANPPIPTGWQLMPQSAVTSDMTTWAVMILNDPVDYPMFSTTTKTFTLADGGTLDVLARVEWHPPDFQNGAVHRGVTLYEPL